MRVDSSLEIEWFPNKILSFIFWASCQISIEREQEEKFDPTRSEGFGGEAISFQGANCRFQSPIVEGRDNPQNIDQSVIRPDVLSGWIGENYWLNEECIGRNVVRKGCYKCKLFGVQSMLLLEAYWRNTYIFHIQICKQS